MTKEKHHRFNRKLDVIYVKCQHLKEKMQLNESCLVWAGDKLRFVFCPVCHNGMLGLFVRTFGVNTLHTEYEPTDDEKEFVTSNENWIEKLFRWTKSLR